MSSGTVVVHRNLGVVLGGKVDQNLDITDVLGIAPIFQVILAFDPPGVKISSDSRGFPSHGLVL